MGGGKRDRCGRNVAPGAPPRRPRGSGAGRRGELGTRVTPGLYLAKYRVVGRRGQVGPATWRLGREQCSRGDQTWVRDLELCRGQASAILGWGFTARSVVSNAEICETIDSTDEWIQSRSASRTAASRTPTNRSSRWRSPRVARPSRPAHRARAGRRRRRWRPPPTPRRLSSVPPSSPTPSARAAGGVRRHRRLCGLLLCAVDRVRHGPPRHRGLRTGHRRRAHERQHRADGPQRALHLR